MGIKRIEKIKTEEIRTEPWVASITETLKDETEMVRTFRKNDGGMCGKENA